MLRTKVALRRIKFPAKISMEADFYFPKSGARGFKLLPCTGNEK